MEDRHFFKGQKYSYCNLALKYVLKYISMDFYMERGLSVEDVCAEKYDNFKSSFAEIFL